MKRFIYQILIFTSFAILPIGWLIVQADGYTDPFYLKFTTPKQNNLILGTSRAAQGLQPKVLNTLLNHDFFNYAFTNAHSPYGPTYLESLQKKLNKDQRSGIFIIAVNPWSISSITSDPDDASNFRELNGCLANTSVVNMNPNVIYLFENFAGEYYELFPWNKSENLHLHSDGWLEVFVPMDSTSVSNRTKRKIEEYRNSVLPKYNYSTHRNDYLRKTVMFLRDYGKVYLVRLPVSLEIYEIENILMSDFEDKIKNIIQHSDGYFDLTNFNNDFRYTDGNHLYRESGEVVSRKVAKWIKEKLSENEEL